MTVLRKKKIYIQYNEKFPTHCSECDFQKLFHDKGSIV